MKLHLVEDHQIGQIYTDGIVVALTPKACYDLSLDGIVHSIAEDFFDWTELYGNVDEYMDEQLSWINNIDNLLSKEVPIIRDLNIRITHLFGRNIKMFIDQIILTCKSLDMILKKNGIKKVFHYHRARSIKPADKKLYIKDGTNYQQLLPVICDSKNLYYKSIKANCVERTNKNRNYIIKIGILKNYFNKYFLLTIVAYNNLRNKCKAKPSILFLHLGYGLIELAKRASKNCNVFISRDGKIFKLCKPFRPLDKHHGKDLTDKYLNQIDWNGISEKLLNKYKINEWINIKTEIDVSSVVKPRLRYFIKNICPELLNKSLFYKDLLDKNKINFVITPVLIHLNHFALMISATILKNCKSIRLFHGYQPFDKKKYWQLIETPCNVHIQMINEGGSVLGDDFIKNHEIKSVVSPVFFNSKKLLRVRKKVSPKNSNNSIKRIVFVPTVFMGYMSRIDGGIYPDCWYYHHHVKLIQYFSSIKEFVFIYKDLQSSDCPYNPIQDMIKKHRFGNIIYNSNPLLYEYKKADRVIMDFPSTPMIESLALNIPTLALYHQALRIRENAAKKFSNLLKPFKDFNEVEKHINEFLNSNGSEYLVPVVEGDFENFIGQSTIPGIE